VVVEVAWSGGNCGSDGTETTSAAAQKQGRNWADGESAAGLVGYGDVDKESTATRGSEGGGGGKGNRGGAKTAAAAVREQVRVGRLGVQRRGSQGSEYQMMWPGYRLGLLMNSTKS
jgi:hypothetical protein